MKEEKRNFGSVNLSIGILLFLIIALNIGLMFSGIQKSKQDIISYQDKCNKINLEYLSVTKQFLGNDYIVCYNNSTKQITQIPI